MSGYNLRIEVIGAKELSDAFRKAPQQVTSILKNAVGKTADLVERKAKNYAPIHYGPLRGSIHTEGPTVSTTNIVATVGTNLEYAPYQEYGTGIYGPKKAPIKPVNKKVLAWKKNGQWIIARSVKGTPGKFYMKRAREDGKAYIESVLKDVSSKIMAFLLK